MFKFSSNKIIIIFFASICVIFINAQYFDCILDYKTTFFPSLCTEIIPIEIGESIRKSLNLSRNFQ